MAVFKKKSITKVEFIGFKTNVHIGYDGDNSRKKMQTKF